MALARTLFNSRGWRLYLAAFLVVGAATLRAGDAPPKPARMENRFLFVIESSSSMKSRAPGVEQAVAALLASGLKGELRKGDTIGFWSYSDRLHAEFPMQVWSDSKKDTIAETVQLYLHQLRYEKQGRLDKVWPAMRQVVAKSERLTVIFLYDGEETVRGTPFDEDINALQKNYRREFRAGNLPFVTILAARAGEFVDYTINFPKSISVPHTADPLPPPQTNAPPVVTLAAPAPVPAPPTPPVEQKPLRTIEIVAKPAPVVVPAPAPVVPPPVAAEAPPSVTAPVAAVTNQAVSPIPVVPASPPRQPAEPSVTTATNISSAPAPVSPPPVAPAVVAATAPPPAAPVTPPSTPAPQPTPMPVTLASTGQQAALFVIAISLLTIAVALVVFLLRRSRGHPQPSLISQSIDRPR